MEFYTNHSNRSPLLQNWTKSFAAVTKSERNDFKSFLSSEVDRWQTAIASFLGSGVKALLMFFAFSLLLITKASAQSTDDKTACWAGSNCTSGDFTIAKIYLASNSTGTPLAASDCVSPGSVVKAYLAIEFTNTTSSDRNGIFLSGNIKSNGSQKYIYYCFDGLLPKKSTTRFVAPDQFDWTCGQTITLENGFTGWNSASGPVCVTGCSGTTISKCRSYPSQVIQSPLVANFTFLGSCPNGAQYQTIAFTNTTTGGATPYTYKWEYSSDNGTTWTQFSTVASPTWSPNNATTYSIRLTVTDKNGIVDMETKNGIKAEPCCTTPSVSTNPSDDTKCEGSTVSFTAAATGTPTPTVQWQEKVGSGSFTNITNGTFSGVTYSGATGATLTITGLTASMNGNQYRAVFTTNSACPSANSTAATLTVNPTSVGGSVAAAQTICSGSQLNSSLTLSGNTGAVVRWEKSTTSDFSSGVTNLNVTSTTLTAAQAGTMTQDTWFRAVVKSGVCDPANSGSVKITVNPTSVGGSVAAAQTICSGSQLNSSLTLSGNTGAVVRWEKSTTSDFSSGVTNLNVTSTTLTAAQAGTMTQDTWFRAVVKSGVCDPANSGSVKITVGAIPEKPAFTVTQPSLCGDATGTITICQSIIGFDYTVGTTTKSGTGSSLSFDGLTAGSNPKLSIVNTTGNCTAPQEYSCSDAIYSCSEALVSRRNNVADQEITLNSEPKTKVLAAPNPFNDRIRFTLKSAVSGQGSLELYNMLGQKVKTVYQGYVNANQIQTIEYAVPGAQRANLIYLFRVGNEKTTGKLIGLKH